MFVGARTAGCWQPEHADACASSASARVGRPRRWPAGVLDVLPVHLGPLPAADHLADGSRSTSCCPAQHGRRDGRHSLGLVADYVPAAIAAARSTIAEVNPHVPYTFGDTIVPAERLAAVVPTTGRWSVERRGRRDEDRAIAAHVAALIPDGATIQFGMGGTPDAVLAASRDKRDLGVHSGLISDAFVDLVEAGVVTNARKEIDTGLTVAGVASAPSGSTAGPTATRRCRCGPCRTPTTTGAQPRSGRFFAINSAIEVDLSGQINAETVGGRYVGARRRPGRVRPCRHLVGRTAGRSSPCRRRPATGRSRGSWPGSADGVRHDGRGPTPTSSSPSTASPTCAATLTASGPGG